MKKQMPTDLSQSVMHQIKTGEVRMKPRLYYSLLGIFSTLAIAVSSLIVAYLASMAFFWLRIQTADTMAWGARANLSRAIDSFPWWTLALALASFATAVYLARRHGRLYRHKTSTIALVIMLCSLVLGVGMYYLGIGGTQPRPKGQGQYQRHNAGWRQTN